MVLINNNKIDEALQFRQEKFNDAARDVTKTLVDLADYQRLTGIKQAQEGEHSILLAETTAPLAVIFAVLFGATLAVLITRSLVRPMENAVVALKLITESIGQISDQNMTIASAADEQATVAREVDKNLINIKDLSAQTSAGADETKASGIELAKLAEHLSDLVKQFKV